MKEKNVPAKTKVPDVAAARRASKGGQLHHNVEEPAEENRDPDVHIGKTPDAAPENESESTGE